MLELKYYINNNLATAIDSNDDLTIVDESSENRIKIKVISNKALTLHKASTIITEKVNHNSLFFFNGYQSWTDTKENTYNDVEHDISKLPGFINNMFALDRYGDSLFYKYDSNKLHGYDIFYIKDGNEIFSFNYNYH